MPVDCGSITPKSAQAATAASAAVPPERITSMARSAASGCDVATMAFWAWTVDRPARWKFLIPSCSLYCGFGDLPWADDGACGFGGFLAHSCSAGQCLGTHIACIVKDPGFPSAAPLIDLRDVLQSCRLLSIHGF